MRAAICGFRQRSPQRLAKQGPGDRKTGLTASIMEFMKPRCIWREKKKRKTTQLQHQEKQQQLLKDTSFLTLGQWLLASPGPHNGCTTIGNDSCAFKQSSNKVHPSLYKEEEHLISSKPRERSSIEREVEVDKFDRGEVEYSSLCRSQRGKTKVSFRLSEVTDIIIFETG